MAQIIPFPRRAFANALLGKASLEYKIRDACFAMIEAALKGTIQPDKFFLMYQEGDTCAYLNIGYGTKGLTKSVDLVLQDGLRDDS